MDTTDVDDIDVILQANFNCSSYDLDTFKNIDFNENNNIKMLHLNIRSYSRNIDELLLYLRKLDASFPFMLFSETWLANESDFIEIPGYKAYHSVRGRPSGGVSILVDDQFQSYKLPSLTTNNQMFESVGVKIEINATPINLICIYRPPSLPINNFNDAFSSFLRNLPKDELIFIGGDFNINLIDPNPTNNLLTFKELTQSEFLFPLINIPTRVSESSSTCIDLIFTNSLQNIISGTLNCNITDHRAVFSTIPIERTRVSDLITIEFRDHSPENLDLLRNDLINELSTFHIFEEFSINDRLIILGSIIEKIYFRCCPIRKKKISRKRICSPWITDSLLNSITRKHWLEKHSVNDPAMRNYYNSYKFTLRSAIDRAKTLYFEKKLSPTTNLRQTWRAINALIRPKSSKNSIELLHEGSKISDPTEISNHFNNYFSSVAQNLAANIPQSDIDPLSFLDSNQRSFGYLNCDCGEIVKLFKSLKNKKTSVKDIPVIIYKSVADIIAPFLKDLINESVHSGIFPSILKIARVIPLHKDGSKKQVNNYRPISILPVFSKIFEKVMKSRIISFFEKYDLFSPNQYGFRSKKSTTDAVLHFLDDIYTTFNDKKTLLAIYLDFSKAFDTIDHHLLCQKLNYYGIRGNINSWFKSYLSDRKQFVAIKNSNSVTKNLSLGVPQGSILGPLLFLIYINDMQKCTTLKMIHYADDSTAVTSHNNLNHLCAYVNSELQKIDDWTRANKLSLNVNKTNFSLFTNKRLNEIPNIIIRNHIIQRANTQKFLGIFVDERLSFKKHIDATSNKVSSGIGIIKKLKNFIAPSILLKIYNSIIYPHIIYGVEAWGSSSKVGRNRLNNLINKARRLIGLNHAEKILPLVKTHERFCLTRLFKYYVKKDSCHFYAKYFNQLPTHSILTRFNSNNLFTIPKIKVSKYCSSFFYSSIKYWNRLSSDTRNIKRPNKFKKKLNTIIR